MITTVDFCGNTFKVEYSIVGGEVLIESIFLSDGGRNIECTLFAMHFAEDFFIEEIRNEL